MAAGLVALLLSGMLGPVLGSAPGQADAVHSARGQAAPLALHVGEYRITAEIADTPQRRALGLMYRDRLAPDHGMLFVFDRAARHCMFMRNTRIPLSAAFLDADGKILAIARMQPFSERLHCAPRQVSHVLEMDQGWFAARGIGPGDRIEGLDRSPPDPAD
jgi:uncharacterized membrane protein (UPF0127 family)